MQTFLFFFFNDTATTEIYTLSLHDALPILLRDGHDVHLALITHVREDVGEGDLREVDLPGDRRDRLVEDRKSTRLNSSHGYISYAVFFLKKKKKKPDEKP